ncbi:MAG: amino acid ABC transporter substrate-binding protein [Ardenticatenales bacterium]|nr:amino acid ABC transporter substrate-binding protein [Ardenticatenales bacterium]
MLGLLPLIVGCGPLRHPDPVIKVGLLAPLDGARRLQGNHLLPAVRAATPAQVQGRRIEWVILDTQGEPDIAAQRAQELLADPAVIGVVGPLLPSEVEAVAPVVAGKIAWWPLAPDGEAGVTAWLGEPLAADAGGWGSSAWLALRRGEISAYYAPRLPADLGDFAPLGGAQPWPQDWLAWQATQNAFTSMEQASALTRSAVMGVATPPRFGEATRYLSTDGQFPGQPQ